jgi:hypothetical protein
VNPTAPPERPAPVRERLRDLTEHILYEDATAPAGALARLRGRLAVGDTVNRNGRLYPTTVLAAAAAEASKAADAGELIGLLDHPDWFEGAKGTPSKTVIKWERVWMDGPELWGEGLLLDTQHGRDLDAQRKAGVKLGLSTNGYATSRFVRASDVDASLDPDDLVQVIEDLELLTVDVVNDPATVGAAIAREARALREGHAAGKEKGMNTEEMGRLREELAAERAARQQAETDRDAARQELEKAKAELEQARRDAVITEALAGQAVPEPVRDAMTVVARAAETVEEARERVKALAAAYQAGGGHGNNRVPEEGAQTTDALAEARREIGVTLS